MLPELGEQAAWRRPRVRCVLLASITWSPAGGCLRWRPASCTHPKLLMECAFFVTAHLPTLSCYAAAHDVQYSRPLSMYKSLRRDNLVRQSFSTFDHYTAPFGWGAQLFASLSSLMPAQNHLNLQLYAPMALRLFSSFKSWSGCSHEDARLSSTVRTTYRLLLLIVGLLRFSGLHDALVSAL